MKVLVTGADGFIGSHLTELLVRSGIEVKASVLYNSFNSWGWLDYCSDQVKSNLEVFAGDIRDPYGVKASMRGCDAVIHLAALIAIPYSYICPSSYVNTNVMGTLNILQAAKELELDKIIHTSTSEVYGTAKYVPINEEHSLNGQSPYAATKIGADQLANSFFKSFSMPIVTLRPFNTYGARQSARAVIPTIITQINKNGKTIKLGATKPTRDFNYIKDTIQAFLCTLQNDKGYGEVYNIGSNYEVSIKETVEIISQIMNKSTTIISDDLRLRPTNSEVERLWADNMKFKNTFNWEPKYAGKDGFKKGLEETIKWFLNSDNIKKYKTDIYNV